MTQNIDVHPLVSPWGRFGLYSFFIDAPEPAIVDTGIASSPAEGMAPALAAIGRRIEDVRWILLTHGHIDHVGGAHALWELTGRRAQVVIHEADAPLLRSRRAHVDEYLEGRGRYLNDPDGEAKATGAANAVISAEMEPSLLVRGGETLSLGGSVTVSVHAIPGHTAGSVAYVVDGQQSVFVGDAVQVHGAANGFPGYMDPAAYRASLEYLRDEVRPQRLYLGHPYRRADGTPYGVELDAAEAQEAIAQSLAAEGRITTAACDCLRDGLPDGAFLGPDTPSPYAPYAPFARVAEQVGYTGDPTLEPSPFFTSMHGYRVHHALSVHQARNAQHAQNLDTGATQP
ncbi:MBL fold metallo-hydrolase [Actinospica durhamensis]|uniref:MBL fold metallo-hydrolase n=1 Tax=Actinospica durhamensis TaxID=1508375 RepID=A0A941ESW5_9ACTN|nr:MBL fold metallo-hydrolase [Actinospica durhamensis]MBR7837467.1 MBL fold metallo-hydrolase [Actinospica durhamensis]